MGQTHIPSAAVSPPAIRYTSLLAHSWALLYREFKTEFLGCLYGSVTAARDPWQPATITLAYMLLADVKPSRSTGVSVAEAAPCPAEAGLLGMVHSHPGGRSCIHDGRGNCAPLADRLQGDICVASRADSASFDASPFLIDAIVCGIGTFIVRGRTFPTLRCEYDADADRPICLNDGETPALVIAPAAGLPSH